MPCAGWRYHIITLTQLINWIQWFNHRICHHDNSTFFSCSGAIAQDVQQVVGGHEVEARESPLLAVLGGYASSMFKLTRIIQLKTAVILGVGRKQYCQNEQKGLCWDVQVLGIQPRAWPCRGEFTTNRAITAEIPVKFHGLKWFWWEASLKQDVCHFNLNHPT